MIKSISLTGFKSFLHRELSFSQLTVLSGLNSSGKSSIIQALMMLEKAANKENSILLDGHGTVDDIKNNYYNEDLEIGVENESGHTFHVKIPLSNSKKQIKVTSKNKFDFPEIIYVAAHRFGPRTYVPMYTDSSKRNRLGANGDNLFQCIEEFQAEPLNSLLIHENSEGETLRFNINGWLSVISPNMVFDYQLNKMNDTSYSTFDDHRAMNVGFGLSYVLPVITALLVGTLIPNCLVIIENPEAHLHPKGQTEIARLISLCAQTGTQIIIETHSDHLFDGIRIAAKNTPGFAKDVQIHWFELNKEKNTEVYSPILDDNGRINEWPKGFFDQFETNASQLL